MEEKKTLKIRLIYLIVIGIVIVGFIFGILYYYHKVSDTNNLSSKSVEESNTNIRYEYLDHVQDVNDVDPNVHYTGYAFKPIIYLYPTEKTNVKVKLLKENNITCSYPKYKDEWNVLANSNGDLIDIETNRSLYSLYYESENDIEFKVEKEGFVVKGEDSAKFLEEKLSILGLTDREAEEFIVYWLPKLEANNYNYIRFASIDEINENMPLEITPNPDTIIRVLMTYKGLDNKVEVEEQKLETPNRTGFVFVEWGGSEIK